MIVLGIDPGFASMGVAVVDVRERDERVIALDVVRTQKDDRKRRTLASDDNVRRARELAVELGGAIGWLGNAGGNNARVVCAEAMSFPRNASAASKVALSWGVICALAEVRDLPIVQASPQQIKKAVAGTKTASKLDVESALLARYGNELEQLVAHLPDGQHEHAYDALAAVVACLDSDVLRMARRVG